MCMQLYILRIPGKDSSCGVKKSDKINLKVNYQRVRSMEESGCDPNMARHKTPDLCSLGVATESLVLCAKGSKLANN